MENMNSSVVKASDSDLGRKLSVESISVKLLLSVVFFFHSDQLERKGKNY